MLIVPAAPVLLEMIFFARYTFWSDLCDGGISIDICYKMQSEFLDFQLICCQIFSIICSCSCGGLCRCEHHYLFNQVVTTYLNSHGHQRHCEKLIPCCIHSPSILLLDQLYAGYVCSKDVRIPAATREPEIIDRLVNLKQEGIRG